MSFLGTLWTLKKWRVQVDFFFMAISITLSLQIKKISNFKILSSWVFVAPNCQGFKILWLVWTLTPNKFWTKCLKCLIFTQTIAFHPYFIDMTSFISIWLQLNHNGSSNLLKNYSKLNFLGILSYHYGFLFLFFLVNLHHFVEHYGARKDEEPIWSGKWDKTV